MNLGCDIAQVLGEERQSAEGFAYFREQVISGPVDPAAVDGGRLAGVNLPELLEAAEVIEADVVALPGYSAEARDPPGISLLLHHVPAVQRVAPALSRLAEEVRR